MKRTNILSVGLLAAAAGALLSPSAKAQNAYNTGDLLLGFEQAGNASDYVVDIGPASYYLNLQAGTTTNITISQGLGNLAADLQSSGLFGSAWATNYPATSGTANVQWGVIGATSNSLGGTNGVGGTFGLPKNTLFETSAELTIGTYSSPLQRKASGLQGTVNNNILTVANAFNGSAQTANSNYAEIQTASDATSWSFQTPGSTAFGTSYSIEQPSSGNYTGPTNSQLDLYELRPGSGNGILVGSFTLDSSANLNFITPVPEPSTYAALGMGASILMVFIRKNRRSLQS